MCESTLLEEDGDVDVPEEKSAKDAHVGQRAMVMELGDVVLIMRSVSPVGEVCR